MYLKNSCGIANPFEPSPCYGAFVGQNVSDCGAHQTTGGITSYRYLMKQVAKAVVGEPTSNAVHYLQLQASNEGPHVALRSMADCLNLDNLVPVSYTHLTLPTSDGV